MNKMQLQKDRIRDCLIGGAVGDALGYPVEFIREREIFFNYGNDGITAYEKRGRKRQAWISDDTQMTLFTADGLVRWNREKKEGKRPSHYVQDSYQYWLKTQELPFQADRFASAASNDPSVPWLCSIPELYELRAPGIPSTRARDAGA